MKNSNNNTYMFKGNETIKSVNDASFMFGKYVCRELEAIGMRSSYRHVMKPLMEQDGMTQLELVNPSSRPPQSALRCATWSARASCAARRTT